MGCGQSKPQITEAGQNPNNRKSDAPIKSPVKPSSANDSPVKPVGIAAAAAAAAAARSKKLENGESPRNSDSAGKKSDSPLTKSILPNPFTTLGVHFAYIKQFIEVCGGEAKLRGKTTREVVKQFIEPTCKPKGQSIVSQLHTSVNEYNHIGKANWFVSHSLDYKFLDTVEAISRKVEQLESYNEDSDIEVYLWIDIFSLPQTGQQSPITDSKALSEGMVSTMREIGSMMMVLTPYLNPQALHDAWCVFEFYACVKSTANIDIALTKHDVEDASRLIVDAMSAASSNKPFNDAFEKMLDTLDTEKNKATFPHDKELIDKAVKDLGQYNVLNKVLKGKMLKALGREAANERMVAGRKLEIGSHYDKALDKYEEAVAIREFSKLEKPTIVSAMIARARAHYEHATSDMYYTEVFETAVNTTDKVVLHKVESAKNELYKMYLRKNGGPSNGIKVLLEKCGYEKFSNFAVSAAARAVPATAQAHHDEFAKPGQPPSKQGWVTSDDQSIPSKASNLLPPPRKPMNPNADADKNIPTTVISEEQNAKSCFCC